MNGSVNYVCYVPQPAPKKTNGMAVASLVLGILGLVFSCLCGSGVVLSVISLILAIASGSQTEDRKMSGAAVAGLVLSIINIVLVMLLGLLWLLMYLGILGGSLMLSDPAVLEEIFGEIFRELDSGLSLFAGSPLLF